MCLLVPLTLAFLATLSPVGAVRPTQLEETQRPFEYTPAIVWERLSRVTPVLCRKQVEGLFEELLELWDKSITLPLHDWKNSIADFMGRKVLLNGINGAAMLKTLATAARMKLKVLAKAQENSMLWAGFWEGPGAVPNRTTKKALMDFADLMGMQTVHPGTALGRLVQNHGDLSECGGPSFKDPGEIIANFWTKVSRLFIDGIWRRKQMLIPVLVNKDLHPEAERSLQKSVLWRYELPMLKSFLGASLHIERVGDRWWHPKIVFVDMRGTCNYLMEKVEDRLRLGEQLSLYAACLPCTYPCKLDNQLKAAVLQMEPAEEKRMPKISHGRPKFKYGTKRKKSRSGKR